MKPIKAHSTSPEIAIRDKSSTKILKTILVDLWIENLEEILAIFNKVKTYYPINNEEKKLLLDVVKRKDFEEAFLKIKKELLKIWKWKEEVFEYNSLLVAITKLTTTSNIIYMLEQSKDWFLQLWSDINLKIFYNWKEKFVKILDDNWEYSIATDLRWRSYYLLCNLDDSVILESKKEILLWRRREVQEWLTYIEWWEKNHFDYVIYNREYIQVSKESLFYNSPMSLYVIDPISVDKNKWWQNLTIFKIDKDSNRLTVINLIERNLLESEGPYLLLFNPPVQYMWEYEDWEQGVFYSDWELSLYSLISNKDILNNIHHKYYLIEDWILYCLSMDSKIYYKFDLRKTKTEEVKVSDIKWIEEYESDDEKWEYILNKK